MATYYISSSGADTNNGTDPSTPWLHPPMSASATDTSGSHTHTAGDIYLLKRGDTWWDKQFIDLSGLTDVTISSYYNADGSDDFTQPKPKWLSNWDTRTGAWINYATDIDYYSFSNPVGRLALPYINEATGAYDTNAGASSIFPAKQAGTIVTTLTSTVDGNGEYTGALATQPDFVATVSGTNTITYLTEGTYTSLTADQWDWNAGTLYVEGTLSGFDSTTDSVIAYYLTASTPWCQFNNNLYVYAPTSYASAYGSNENHPLHQGPTATGWTWIRQGECAIYVTDCTDITIENLELWGGVRSAVYVTDDPGNETNNDTVTGFIAQNLDINYLWSSNTADNNAGAVRALCTDASNSLTGLNFRNIYCDKKMRADTEQLPALTGDGSFAGREPGGDVFSVRGAINGCTISNCHVIDGGHDMFTLSNEAGTTQPFQNILMEYCTAKTVHSNYVRAIGFPATLEGTSSSANIIVRNNYFHANVQSQISGRGLRIYGNIFTNPEPEKISNADTSTSGVVLRAFADGELVDVIFANNLIVNSYDYGLRLSGDSTATNSFDDVYVHSNIILNSLEHWADTTRLNPYQLLLLNISDMGSNVNVYKNIFFSPIQAPGGIIINNESTGESLATAETNETLLYDNIEIDPLLDDSYFPASTSPCLNAGTTPLSKFDAYSRPNWGNHIGAVWPRINTSKTRRSF